MRIVAFRPEHAAAVKALNYAWLEKYFRVEPGDALALSDPQKHILDAGGFIFCAEQQGKVLGTVSLLRISNSVFELGKMAVAEASQGLGVGKMLLEHALDFATQNGIKKVQLYSNTALKPAISLYRKYGFESIPLESGVYARADIKMEKTL